MKTMFNLIKRSGEVSFRDISEIAPGCTVGEEMDGTLIATYGDKAEALEALKAYTATVYSYDNLKNRLVITEYLVEEYTADDDGEFFSGSDFYTCKWPESFDYHGKTYTMQPDEHYRAIWYAVVEDADSQWDNGSFDLEEAKRIARDLREEGRPAFIAVIDDTLPAPFCLDEIHDID